MLNTCGRVGVATSGADSSDRGVNEITYPAFRKAGATPFHSYQPTEAL